MTQEENAKVYTELINRLENVKNAIKKQNYGIAMDLLCNPYPEFQITTSTELRESEDEKVRKHLISLFKKFVTLGVANECETSEIKVDDILAWLEKQGEQKPAWSEEDKKAMSRINYLLYTNCANVEGEYLEKWLNSLKDRVQPKQEWDKDDDKHCDRILKELREQKQKPVNAPYIELIDSDIDWLKSLKDRYTWEPSEEQLHYLHWIANVKLGDSAVEQEVSKHLNELYEQLKNLI